MKKIKTIATSALAVAAVCLGVASLVALEKPKVAVKGAETVAATVGTDQLSFTAVQGTSVLEQLKQHAKVEMLDTAYGSFVEAINGVHRSDGRHWNFYVNGNLAQQSAATFMPVGGEQVTWRLE